LRLKYLIFANFTKHMARVDTLLRPLAGPEKGPVQVMTLKFKLQSVKIIPALSRLHVNRVIISNRHSSSARMLNKEVQTIYATRNKKSGISFYVHVSSVYSLISARAVCVFCLQTS